ncbi:hypothetical protein J6590_059138 [Homalodisca vitripennis]|nr:hypothetical protein J6590_059138 [Homalodisca vitripennis]
MEKCAVTLKAPPRPVRWLGISNRYFPISTLRKIIQSGEKIPLHLESPVTEPRRSDPVKNLSRKVHEYILN